jgi:nucleoside-diphosphate-sugar epimerase
MAWAGLGGRCAVDIFRLAGIYGPGRSALDDVRSGRARRVIKPDHAFGRIHRDDIAAAVLAAMGHVAPGVRVFNLSDDLPAASADVIAEAADLLGMPRPPEVAFADAWAAMSPMARSFWAENRRVRAERTKAVLGIAWRYPTYREGLRAVLHEEAGDGGA